MYSQRNQTNNAIGAASGELQGFLTFSNLCAQYRKCVCRLPVARCSRDWQCAAVVYSKLQPGFSSAPLLPTWGFQIGEPYFQDDWKVTSRLTLNLGLRISLFGTYHEKNKNAWNWEAGKFNASRFAVNPCSGVLLYASMAPCKGNSIQFNVNNAQLDPGLVSDMGLVQCGVNGTPASCMTGHLFNPAPRIGFAWDPQGRRQDFDSRRLRYLFEHGTGNEANTGSLEASAPLVLSMTQPLPLSYQCIGNLGYGPAFNQTYSSLCQRIEHLLPLRRDRLFLLM